MLPIYGYKSVSDDLYLSNKIMQLHTWLRHVRKIVVGVSVGMIMDV